MPFRITKQPSMAALALAGMVAGARAGLGPAVEMSSSAILFYNSEFDPIQWGPYNNWPEKPSQCELLVMRAAKEGGKRLNIVPTHYWTDQPGTAEQRVQPSQRSCNPDAWATYQNVNHYCVKDQWDSTCVPFTQADIQKFENGFTNCLSKALELGFDEVLISPHLDDGTHRGYWRNLLVFDPIKKYGDNAKGDTEWSYEDIMLTPIFNAAKKAYANAPASKTFTLGLQGEMGGTVFAHPDSYLKLHKKLHKAWDLDASFKTAILLNHGYLPGIINRKAAEAQYGAIPVSRWWRHDGGYGEVLPLEDWDSVPNQPLQKQRVQRIIAQKDNLKKLLYAVDVVGISNYARTTPDIKVTDLESGSIKYEAELKELGVSLKDLISKPGKQYYWNEFAIGGGISECGNVTAQVGSEAGKFPWLGITSGWSADNNPWMVPNTADYMRKYYSQGLALLAQGGINYRVSGAFLWNVVSWDVQGLHTASQDWSCDQGGYTCDPAKTFADKATMDAIRTHNRKVHSAAVIKKAAVKKPSRKFV